jgi:NAD(P)-dependent dehydrogenase (short-subunit alcohol dehydrogenase family)
MRFQDQVVIVTGAARGLGRRYAERFAGEGANVVVADLRDDVTAAASEIADGGGTAIAVQVDVNDEAATRQMAEQTVARFGRIDVLVNNAGIWGDYEVKPLLEIDPGYWDLVMGVNVRGPLLCSRAVAPTMVAQGRGRIVNISSIGAYMVSGVYGVSKLALNQLTFALAKELGHAGVTVNAVAPGPIDNEASRKQVPPAAMERLRDSTLVKRLGHADDIYGMIAYLASDDAAWVTGQTYLVNGGFSARF